MADQPIRIGLISDVHATPEPVREALQIFKDSGVETILCAGDIAGYGRKLEQTVALLIESGCRSVFGNHDLWYFEQRDIDPDGPAADYLCSLPVTVQLEVVGLQLLMVHASPPDSLMDGIRLLDEEGQLIASEVLGWRNTLAELAADILIVGHTHQVFAESLDDLLVINPGSTLFNHTCAILTLPEKTVRFYPLSGKEPVLSWNFGMLARQ